MDVKQCLRSHHWETPIRFNADDLAEYFRKRVSHEEFFLKKLFVSQTTIDSMELPREHELNEHVDRLATEFGLRWEKQRFPHAYTFYKL